MKGKLEQLGVEMTPALYTVAFLAVFTAPFVEEVIYRGILYSALQRTTGTVLAVVIVTLLFAAVHVPQYWGSPSTIMLLTTFGRLRR